MILSIISAIGNNNEIGKANALLWNLPLDMKHFKETTTGHTVIMGQNTFLSIGRPLLNRRNIVITLDESFYANGVEIVHSTDELEKLLNETMSENEEAFIIGGGMIYKLFINKADKLYITHVDMSDKEADTYFPVIDKDKWEKVENKKYKKDEKNIYNLEFAIYNRKSA